MSIFIIKRWSESMRVLFLSLIFSLSKFGFATVEFDKNAIKNMGGCYEVNYYFKETESLKPGYEIVKEPYRARGIEYIAVEEKDNRTIELQHILKISDNSYLKHWRQVWTYEPDKYVQFKGLDKWSVISGIYLGKWSQEVFQVDDSPRYGCVALWQHGDEASSWTCQSWSPLPRREFSRRNDYNVLDRQNSHIVFSNGWRHEQSNTKLIFDGQSIEPLAKEIGRNEYKKISDARCGEAEAYWLKIKPIWQVIQEMWSHILEHHPNLVLKKEVNGKPLWVELFKLAENFSEKLPLDDEEKSELSKFAHDTIHQWMQEN